MDIGLENSHKTDELPLEGSMGKLAWTILSIVCTLVFIGLLVWLLVGFGTLVLTGKILWLVLLVLLGAGVVWLVRKAIKAV